MTAFLTFFYISTPFGHA